MPTPIGDPRPSGIEGPAGDQRPPGDDGPAGDPRPAGEQTASQTAAFDPADHTVAEVLDHIKANPNQADDIRNAEANGKDRAGIAAS